jgi:[ribosomal protein S5]-alanine N-acetyltransferase
LESVIFPEVFETARLRLRPPRLEDAAVIFETYAQDPFVTRYLMWPPHRSVETTEKFVSYCIERRAAKTAFPFVLTRLTDGQLLGMIELQAHQHGTNIGYVLAREHWGQGLMPEAARAVVSYALTQPAIFRVQAFCDVENTASARTLEKTGMLREGILRRYIVHPAMSSEPRDCYLYAITR